MLFSTRSMFTVLAALTVCTGAAPSPITERSNEAELAVAAKPPTFILAGDSTTAEGGGWGHGFLAKDLKNGATGQNLADGGETTVSFRNGGFWAKVISAVKSSAANYQPYVTIQFGHNDQKSSAGISMSQFQANIEKFVSEVKAAGGIPIVLTSLSRRSFSGSPAKVVENLADVTAAAIKAASASGATLLDLNKASTAYLNSIGPDNAHTYNLATKDYTHLNDQGSIVFGGLVATLFIDNVPAVKDYLQVNANLAKALSAGTYYWPS